MYWLTFCNICADAHSLDKLIQNQLYNETFMHEVKKIVKLDDHNHHSIAKYVVGNDSFAVLCYDELFQKKRKAVHKMYPDE